MITILKKLLVILLTVAGPAAIAQAAALHEADLFAAATVVAEVTVIAYEESGATGTMFYTVEVERCLKGEMQTTTELVRVPKKPAAEQRVAGGGKLRVGERATLYLTIQQGPRGPLSYVLGMLPLHGDNGRH